MFFSQSEYCNNLTWGIYTFSLFRNARDHNGRICLSHLDLFPTVSPVSALLTAH